MRKRFLTLTLAVISLAVLGQTGEVGLFGGVSYYIGDLNPAKHFLSSKPAYGVVARVNLNPRWSFTLNGYRGTVTGDDYVSNTNTSRGLQFESEILDISAVAEFNFFEYITGSKRDVFTPYIFGGIGYFHFNPESAGVKLRDIGTEGQQAGFEDRKPYNLHSVSIPFGIGFKYSISRRFGLTAFWGMRKTFTDYLDDVSRTYYLNGAQIDPDNSAQVLSDPTFQHQPYMERGNPTTNDWFNFSGVTLTYKFNLFGKRKCDDQPRSGVN